MAWSLLLPKQAKHHKTLLPGTQLLLLFLTFTAGTFLFLLHDLSFCITGNCEKHIFY